MERAGPAGYMPAPLSRMALALLAACASERDVSDGLSAGMDARTDA